MVLLASPSGDAAEKLIPVVPVPTEEIFFLNTLLRPTCSISRIREHVKPAVGSFSLQSEFEFEIPKDLASSSLYLPVILQGKSEFTRDLKVTTVHGEALRRLNDSELSELLYNAFVQVFEACGWPAVEGGILRKIIDEALSYDAEETDEEFYMRVDSLSKAAGVNNVGREGGSQASFIAEFFLATRFVKPICYKLDKPRASESPRSYVVLNVGRRAPLVPVRQSANNLFENTLFHIRRLLTKRRSHYYFGLGNADCARSYHLSFSGPDSTYLSDIQIEGVGEDDEFFICEDAGVNVRYDQTVSRMFIRNGQGFSKAALSIWFEKRSQRPLAALTICSLACLLGLLDMFFEVMVSESTEINNIDALLPLSVLSIGTLISIWQAIEDYQAEEWLWISAGGLAVASVAAIIGILFKSQLANVMGEYWKIAWAVCITIDFVSAELAGLCLFTRLKLHGFIMDRIPKIRRATVVARSTKLRQHFTRLNKQQEERLKKENEAWGQREPAVDEGGWTSLRKSEVDLTDGPSFELSPERSSCYTEDIKIYRSLVSEAWTDGWLMPIWSSSMNPHRLPSRAFCRHVGEILGYEVKF